jgi:hypothetical protein
VIWAFELKRLQVTYIILLNISWEQGENKRAISSSRLK